MSSTQRHMGCWSPRLEDAFLVRNMILGGIWTLGWRKLVHIVKKSIPFSNIFFTPQI